ncbi:MAG: DUF465 domain-containing protein [Alphaproteobacteria bacterium]|jgi:hypothetical protein|nr:DUF465 domain-containing protein [Alphaproteobacteria bacterium]MBT5389200.1 DUF465 domain-containing protein [Alphaproteobacteria bacterium]MBT5540881.1 DUF465 domain-containing protein [Alphaproteobacteria bacterium]
MTMSTHIEALKERREGVDRNIKFENCRPYPDEAKLHELKRKRLLIKDEIIRLACH